MQIKQWLLILFCFSLLAAQAQQKSLTDEQYFRNDLKDLVQPLPRTGKWVNKNELIIINGTTASLLNASTGKQTNYVNPTVTTELPGTPDVYKKRNDLYQILAEI